VHGCFQGGLVLAWVYESGLANFCQRLFTQKNLKILLRRLPYGHHRQFFVKMNGAPWPKDGRPVSLTRLLTARRKSMVKAG
jgi:hypothetical protein